MPTTSRHLSFPYKQSTLYEKKKKMESLSKSDNPTTEDESQAVTRRIQRLTLHLTPLSDHYRHHQPHLHPSPCSGGGGGNKAKIEVNKTELSNYMRGKHREIQDRVLEYFNSMPDLQTPIEISKDEHRELCWRQLVGLVREAGIKPFRYVVEDPAKYFAIVEAVGSVDMSLGIKLGVQYR